MKNILFILSFLFTFCCSLSAQHELEENEFIEVDRRGDSLVYEYYYDFDMPKYSLGLNFSAPFSIFPAITMTHDIGLDDYRRIGLETGVLLFPAQRQGFKLRSTYQKFFYKSERFGVFYGAGLNLVSFWEPRVEDVFLENTFLRTLSEVRNQSVLSGVGEIGCSFVVNNRQMLEFTFGLGVGVHRAGGSFAVVREFNNFNAGFLQQEPGFYTQVPVYFSIGFSDTILSFDFERE